LFRPPPRLSPVTAHTRAPPVPPRARRCRSRPALRRPERPSFTSPACPSRPHLWTGLLSVTGKAEATRAMDSVPRPCRPPARRSSPCPHADHAPLCGCDAQLPANRHRSCSSQARSLTSRLPTPGASLLPCAVPSSSLPGGWLPLPIP